MAIKFKLKVLLAMNKMTQKQFAIATGIRPSTISAICNNMTRHLPLDALDKICGTLHCTIDDLMEHTPDYETAKVSTNEHES